MVTTRSGKKTSYQPTKYQMKKAMSMSVPKPISLTSAIRKIARSAQETKVFYNTTSFNMFKTGLDLPVCKKYFDPFSGIQPGVGLLQRVGDEIFVTKIIIAFNFKTFSDAFTDYKFCGKLVSSSAFQTFTTPGWNDYSGTNPNYTTVAFGNDAASYLNQIEGIHDKEQMRLHSEKKHTFRAASLVPGPTVNANYGFGAGISTWKHTITLNRKIRFDKATSAAVPSSTEFIYLLYGLGGKENVDSTGNPPNNVDNIVSCTYAVFFKDG